MSGQTDSKNRKELNTGSPQKGEPFYIAIGKLRRSHGIQGEILMDILTDFPTRFKAGVVVFVGKNHTPHTIRSFRLTGDASLIAFEGFETCEAVGIFRNQLVYGALEDSPKLSEGEFYHHEILGMQVLDESGKLLGTLSEILQTGANDVYVVTDSEKNEMLLPAIKSVILSIEPIEKKIVVRPPEWE